MVPQPSGYKVAFECDCLEKTKQDIVWEFVLSERGGLSPPPTPIIYSPPVQTVAKPRVKVVMQRHVPLLKTSSSRQRTWPYTVDPVSKNCGQQGVTSMQDVQTNRGLKNLSRTSNTPKLENTLQFLSIPGSPEPESPVRDRGHHSWGQSVSDSKNVTAPEATMFCTNYHTTNTPLWRRNPENQPLCNDCGLFLKLHDIIRPLSLKTDVIKRRVGGRN